MLEEWKRRKNRKGLNKQILVRCEFQSKNVERETKNNITNQVNK